MFTNTDLQDFLDGYFEAAEFTDCGPDDEENHDAEGWSSAAREQARSDCQAFMLNTSALLHKAIALPDYSLVQAGHDFWFTRNGHGVGFWDRTQLESGNLGDALTFACRSYREVNVYKGDDEYLYIC